MKSKQDLAERGERVVTVHQTVVNLPLYSGGG